MKITRSFCWPPYLKVGAHVSIDEDGAALELALNPLFSLNIEFYYGWLRGWGIDLSLLGFFLEFDATHVKDECAPEKENQTIRSPFEVGDTVSVVSGPFAGWGGTICGIGDSHGNRTVRVAFRNSRPLWLPKRDLKRIEEN